VQPSPGRAAPAWHAVDGVLLLDKPFGVSSNTALQRARRIFGARKAGHTGTLDPYATGLLPICFGEATKFARFLLDADKGYTATLALGATSTTGDAEGEVSPRTGVVLPEAAAVDSVLARFIGTQSQRAPLHSAIKMNGKPLYEYARRGIEVEPPVRDVTILRLVRTAFDGPRLVVDVTCTKGTYIRALAEDIGEALGCGAYLAGLRRTSTGGFDVVDALDFEALERYQPAAREAGLLGPDCLARNLPELGLDAAATAAVVDGRAIARPGIEEGLHLRLYDPDRAFLGIGETVQGSIRPFRMMATESWRGCAIKNPT